MEYIRYGVREPYLIGSQKLRLLLERRRHFLYLAGKNGKLSLSDEVGGHISEYVGHRKAMELIGHADEIYCRFGAPETVHGGARNAAWHAARSNGMPLSRW